MFRLEGFIGCTASLSTGLTRRELRSSVNGEIALEPRHFPAILLAAQHSPILSSLLIQQHVTARDETRFI
jgi:hypothetical protein